MSIVATTCKWTVAVVFAALLSPAAAALGQGMRTYTSLAFGWSVEYPSDWAVNDTEPGAVVVTTPPPARGLVTISTYQAAPHSKFTALAPLVDFLLDFRARSFAAQGASYVVTGREDGSLSDGTSFVLLTDEIGGPDGGKSEVLVALKGDDVFTVVAETYAAEWPLFSERFHDILTSFTLAR